MATVREMKATARPKAGKGAARAVRRSGRVPGVIYGDSKDPIAISVDHAELKQRIYAGHFLTTVYDLDVDGAKHRVIPRDFQLDPVKDLPVHVDFLRLSEGVQIRVRIPVHVMNAEQAPGVKRGGTVNIVTHTVEVICAPGDFDKVKAGLEKAGLKADAAEVTMKALAENEFTGADADKMRGLLEALDELDDVQNVYTTAALEE